MCVSCTLHVPRIVPRMKYNRGGGIPDGDDDDDDNNNNIMSRTYTYPERPWSCRGEGWRRRGEKRNPKIRPL